MSIGIDYGRGQTNIDHKTGIRYGVIHQNEVLQAWADSSEPDTGPHICPKCGNEAIEYDDDKHSEYEIEKYSCKDFACEGCKFIFDSSDVYPDDVENFYLEDEEYSAWSDSYGDIFVMRSPYFTWARFCSPCAPGALSLSCHEEPSRHGPICYCFDHTWFDSGKAPYRVFRIDSHEEVFPEETK